LTRFHHISSPLQDLRRGERHDGHLSCHDTIERTLAMTTTRPILRRGLRPLLLAATAAAGLGGSPAFAEDHIAASFARMLEARPAAVSRMALSPAAAAMPADPLQAALIEPLRHWLSAEAGGPVALREQRLAATLR
jgi:hypothetical protein